MGQESHDNQRQGLRPKQHMPEIIATRPNGRGVKREDILENALISMNNKLSELPEGDRERLWLMLSNPHLSYTEGVAKLRRVVEEYNQCAEPINADSVYEKALRSIEAQNGVTR